ncbi:MAG TPA: PQQ-dependent sugar dehydrogenase [Gemmatimonadaceae bacterium]|nr:PQQ-dependent sugar dehydrogenase [Gemmatimonadaceae bacterium]
MNMRCAALTLVAGAFVGTACGGDDETPSGPDDSLPTQIVATPVAEGFQAPVHVAAPPGEDALWVVEQAGVIRVVRDGAVLPTPFLDISGKVTSGGEQGLLSIAFDPAYAANGRFYVDYTGADGATFVERYSVSADPNVADPSSAALILTVPQPAANHNGGHLLFGPDDMLYISMGDGGGIGDPSGTAQDTGTLLGKILRLDVSGEAPYTIPPDNPFDGTTGARAEIWAYGLRNPWRMAFDEPSGLLYIADVGEGEFEEVNAVNASAPGLNFGWSVVEGTQCFRAPTCDAGDFVQPVHVYAHTGGRCSVTGGSVYRGALMPAMRGHYFFADLCAPGLHTLRVVGGVAADLREWDIGAIGSVTSFGTDGAGELLLTSIEGGIYRLGPPVTP